MHGPVGDALDQALFDLGERALGDEEVGVGAAKQAVDDRVDDQGGDFQAKLAVQLFGLEQVEAGGVGKGVDEFGVG
jgi:hypothetical protein